MFINGVDNLTAEAFTHGTMQSAIKYSTGKYIGEENRIQLDCCGLCKVRQKAKSRLDSQTIEERENL
jgi:hypothetical protein